MVGTARLLHVHTPTLQAIDARGLVVRSVGWHRQTDGDSAVARIHRAAFDLAGRKTHRWDARLFVEESARANLTHIHSLSGQVLGRDSVDSGWQVSLPGDAGQVRASWDGRGTRRRVDYDGLLRSVAIFEKPAQALEQCIELFDYAGPQDNPANQCGQLTRHDDMVGSVSYSQFGISGVVLEQARRFLTGLELPNWPGSVSLLEAGSGASTRWRYGPAGDVLQETDTMGNVRLYSQTVSGELRQFRLNTPEQGVRTLISDMVYDAQGRLSCEITGNGVVTSLHNDPLDGRLTRVSTDYGQRQDLHYTYDPVGNVVSIQDHAQPTRYFANQQIEPLRTFAYDTLYQLIEATGYEAVDTRRGLGTDKCRQFSTGNELVLYTERYEYDAGRNLRTLVHVGARNFTRRFATAWDSNRSLLDTGAQPPNEEQIANAFDANGNL
ncbi:insecticidal toxin complex protein TccC [Pseudomonas sp. NFACC02]|uniref:hypothetical protein n=1 Tax=Pseudomonas sp. NFACC02 TaxID=1566250 RepID=UPI0008B0FC43|nr:hypothetical protein [Pseudomonas sp. NFACC02]SER98623.1 insecticidal toxin complex protein TccC [Pseudomonas sp. NFACC02]